MRSCHTVASRSRRMAPCSRSSHHVQPQMQFLQHLSCSSCSIREEMPQVSVRHSRCAVCGIRCADANLTDALWSRPTVISRKSSCPVTGLCSLGKLKYVSGSCRCFAGKRLQSGQQQPGSLPHAASTTLVSGCCASRCSVGSRHNTDSSQGLMLSVKDCESELTFGVTA